MKTNIRKFISTLIAISLIAASLTVTTIASDSDIAYDDNSISPSEGHEDNAGEEPENSPSGNDGDATGTLDSQDGEEPEAPDTSDEGDGLETDDDSEEPGDNRDSDSVQQPNEEDEGGLEEASTKEPDTSSTEEEAGDDPDLPPGEQQSVPELPEEDFTTQLSPGAILIETEQDLLDAIEQGYPYVQLIQDIALTAPLIIDDNVDINISSYGDSPVTLYAPSDSRHFFVVSGNTLTLENIILDGGGISNEGTLYLMDGGVITGSIDDSQQHHLGAVSNSSDGTFIMEGGKISDSTSKYGGGVTNFGNFIMKDGEISGNHSTAMGGGAVYNHGTFTMEGGKISNNNAYKGSAILNLRHFTMKDGEISGNNTDSGTVYVEPFSADSTATFVMEGGKIIENHARVEGGGVYVYNASFTMSGGEISRNTSVSAGGGVYLNSDAAFTLKDGEIAGNSVASGDGGGIYITSRDDTSFLMEGGNISGNTATVGKGGGVYNANKFTMTGGKISGNRALPEAQIIGFAQQGLGGGVYLADKGLLANRAIATLLMEGGEISGNSAYYGGGVYSDFSAFFTMTNGEISYNVADSMGGGVVFHTPFVMEGGRISGNSALRGGGLASFLITHLSSSDEYFYGSLKMKGGEISGNRAESYGGGIYIAHDRIEAIITGGTISDNYAAINGGGIHCSHKSYLHNLKISGDTVLRGNTASRLYRLDREDILLYSQTISLPEWSFSEGERYAYNNFDIGYTSQYPFWFVTFDPGDGTMDPGETSQYVLADVRVNLPNEPTRPQHTFTGWYTDAALTTLWDFARNIPTDDMTLYAGWTPDTSTTYTVTFDSNGGSPVASATITEGQPVSIPIEPTLAGHTFDNWYADADLTILWDFSTSITANTTLYAGWTPDTSTTYTVTFDSNGGSPVASATITEGQPVSIPIEPTLAGHTFDNWYADADLTILWDFSTPITANTTLYAGWIADDGNGNGDGNGGDGNGNGGNTGSFGGSSSGGSSKRDSYPGDSSAPLFEIDEIIKEEVVPMEDDPFHLSEDGDILGTLPKTGRTNALLKASAVCILAGAWAVLLLPRSKKSADTQ